jgi:hypothetical protein
MFMSLLYCGPIKVGSTFENVGTGSFCSVVGTRSDGKLICLEDFGSHHVPYTVKRWLFRINFRPSPIDLTNVTVFPEGLSDEILRITEESER